MADERPLFGVLVAVSFQAVRVPRQGWNLVVRRTWDWSAQGAPEVDSYDRLTRGELLSLLDTLRAELDVGTEF